MKRILIIGGGSIGERHLRCFQRTEGADVSLCEIRPELRRQLAERYQLGRTYESLETAWNEPWDAAVICTPANWHIGMALQCVERNIAVLIEKPLSTNQDNIPELIEQVKARNTPAAVAYVLRQHPALAAMKQVLQDRRFGKPVQVVMTGGQHFPFYRPAYRETYYTKRETGGGVIQDALTHTLNAAEWLVGPITKLVADARHCVLPGVEVEDTAHLLTRHGEVLGSFSLNQHQAANESTLTVLCEGGGVRWELHHNRWLSCREPGQPWQVEREFVLERDDLFISQANAFLDQMEGIREAACSLQEGWQTLRVNLAALESLATGGWVTL